MRKVYNITTVEIWRNGLSKLDHSVFVV